MTNNVTQNFPSLPDKTNETVEKDVRKWVESICEFKANLDMEKCELPKKTTKKVKKIKIKKRLSAHSEPGDDIKVKKEPSRLTKPKVTKKEPAKEKQSKEIQSPPSAAVFETLRTSYKKVKLPPNWVSGQSKGRIVFCRVKVLTHGSQYEMVSDRGVAITNDCVVHVFVDGPEVVLSNWKMQKVDTLDDIRKTIKAVDGFKVCSGALPSGIKSPCCSVFLSGDAKICQACKSDMSQMKVAGAKVKGNTKTSSVKASSFQK